MTARLSNSANVLRTHGLSLAEYFVLCSAGYRVTYPPEAFVEHALAASKGDPRGELSIAELSAALDTLRARGLLSCLTQAAMPGITASFALPRHPERCVPNANPPLAVLRASVRSNGSLFRRA